MRRDCGWSTGLFTDALDDERARPDGALTAGRLTVLNVMLKKAAEWDAIERMPCVSRLLPTPKPSARFHDFDAYERLVAAAEATDLRALLIVLLGGEAGLRCGEIMALAEID